MPPKLSLPTGECTPQLFAGGLRIWLQLSTPQSGQLYLGKVERQATRNTTKIVADVSASPECLTKTVNIMIALKEGSPPLHVSWEIGTSNIKHSYKAQLQGTVRVCSSHAARLSGPSLKHGYYLSVPRKRSLRTGASFVLIMNITSQSISLEGSADEIPEQSTIICAFNWVEEKSIKQWRDTLPQRIRSLGGSSGSGHEVTSSNRSEVAPRPTDESHSHPSSQLVMPTGERTPVLLFKGLRIWLQLVKSHEGRMSFGKMEHYIQGGINRSSIDVTCTTECLGEIISVMVAREEGLPLVDISWDIGTSNVHHPYQVTLQGTAQICTSHATRLSIDLARDYRLRVRSLRSGAKFLLTIKVPCDRIAGRSSAEDSFSTLMCTFNWVSEDTVAQWWDDREINPLWNSVGINIDRSEGHNHTGELHLYHPVPSLTPASVPAAKMQFRAWVEVTISLFKEHWHTPRNWVQWLPFALSIAVASVLLSSIAFSTFSK